MGRFGRNPRLESHQLNWRRSDDSYSLHFERRAKALLHVVPDKTYEGMWRIRFTDGSLSDMANLSRAKDAGISHGLASFNRKLRCRETGVEGSYSDLNPKDGKTPLG